MKLLQDALATHALEPGGVEPLKPGTYELCGPKVNQNPEKLPNHVLVPHGVFELDAPRDYGELRMWLAAHDYEGIVWHHRDGRMAKIKRRDFSRSDRGDEAAQE